MSEILGKYLSLAGLLMSAYEAKREEVDKLLFAETGKHYHDVDPEAWYDAKWIKLFLDKYTEASLSGIGALTTFGRKIFPTVRPSLPATLKTPLDYLKYESTSYLAECRGPDVKPRKILKAVEGEFVVEVVVAHFHHYKFYEGLYLGILEMCGAKDKKVTFVPAPGKDEDTYLFTVTWQS